MDYEALSQSAERRLLEHRRRELGASPSAVTTNATWSRTRESPTSMAPAATIDRNGARLDVAVTAWPADGLVPGAVVTVTIVLNNGGIENADSITVAAPIPSGCAYRTGSLKHDGRDADDSTDALFGEGLKIGRIVAAGRNAITWKLDVLAGTTDIIVSPSVQAAVPIVAARPLVLKRGKMSGAFRTDVAEAVSRLDRVPTTHEDVEAPFYELTTEEEIQETAILSAISTSPAPPVVEPAPIAPPRERLYRTLRPGDLSFVERLLEAPLGLLPHFVFTNLLAVATAGDGSDPLGLAAFIDREAALLGRLKVAARLGKPLPLEETTGSPPALEIDHAMLRFVDPQSTRISGAALLSAPLDAQRLTEARNAYDRPLARWLALRLVTLTFCAQGLADDSGPAAAAVKSALNAYALQARLAFVAFGTRMKLDRRLDPTRAATTQLDAAARAVIEAIRGTITESE